MTKRTSRPSEIASRRAITRRPKKRFRNARGLANCAAVSLPSSMTVATGIAALSGSCCPRQACFAECKSTASRRCSMTKAAMLVPSAPRSTQAVSRWPFRLVEIARSGSRPSARKIAGAVLSRPCPPNVRICAASPSATAKLENPASVSLQVIQ